MIEPTVGRIVWVWCNDLQQHPLAAIINGVISPHRISVTVFHRTGITEGVELDLYQGDGEKPLYPYAEWMPYQKGQAAKTEALEKELKK